MKKSKKIDVTDTFLYNYESISIPAQARYAGTSRSLLYYWINTGYINTTSYLRFLKRSIQNFEKIKSENSAIAGVVIQMDDYIDDYTTEFNRVQNGNYKRVEFKLTEV